MDAAVLELLVITMVTTMKDESSETMNPRYNIEFPTNKYRWGRPSNWPEWMKLCHSCSSELKDWRSGLLSR